MSIKSRAIIGCKEQRIALSFLLFALLSATFTLTPRWATRMAYSAPLPAVKAAAPEMLYAYSIAPEPLTIRITKDDKGAKVYGTIERRVVLSDIPTKEGSLNILTFNSRKAKPYIDGKGVEWIKTTVDGQTVYYYPFKYKKGAPKDFSIMLQANDEGRTTIYACKNNEIRPWDPSTAQTSAPVKVVLEGDDGGGGSGSGSVQPIPINLIPDLQSPLILGQEFDVKVIVEYPGEAPDNYTPNYLLVDCTDVYRKVLTPLNADGSPASWPYRLEMGQRLNAKFSIRTTSKNLPEKPELDLLTSGKANVKLWAYYKFHDPFAKYTGEQRDPEGDSFTFLTPIRIAKIAKP